VLERGKSLYANICGYRKIDLRVVGVIYSHFVGSVRINLLKNKDLRPEEMSRVLLTLKKPSAVILEA
jgi:hypothetical protein